MIRAHRQLSPLVPLVSILLLALCARLLVLWQVHADPNLNHLTGDGAAYWRWSDSILSGHWIGGEVFYQTPLYPYFLAILRKLFHANETGVRVIQALLGAIGCGLLAGAARRMINSRAAWIAGAMLALYPPAISYDLQIDKPVLDILLSCALLWSLARILKQPGLTRVVVTGVFCGLLSLNRENALILVPVLCAYFWIHSRPVWITRTLLLIAGAALVVLPVAIRNSVLAHDVVLVTAQFGPNFYIGNNASADGIYHPLRPGRGDAMYERIDATEIAQKDQGRSLSPGEVSHYWTMRTWHDIGENPARWGKQLVRKFAMVFANSELADSDVHDRFVAYSSILSGLDDFYGFGVIFTLGMIGFALSPRKLSLIVAMIASLALTMSLFFIFGRYRIAIVPMLMLLCSAALARLPALLQRGAARDGLIAVIVGVASIGWVALGERAVPQSLQGADAYNRAKYLVERGKLDDAEALYRRAIDQNPRLAAAYNNLGLLLADHGRLHEAIPLLNRAIALDPTDPDAQINLGMTLGRLNDTDGAIEHFRKALHLGPHSSAARYNLAVSLLARGDKSEAITLLSSMASDVSSDPFARRASDLLKRIRNSTLPSRE